MTRDLRRYLLGEVALPAALVNAGINWIAGAALFPAGRAVPMRGDSGIAGDTLVAAFLIGCFTLLLGAPSARRRVRSGRVRGWGRVPWLRIIERRPILSAISCGLACALLLGAPLLAALGALGIEEISRNAYLSTKVGFCAFVGVASAVAVALASIAAEPDVGDDPRWCKDPALPVGGAVYPCDQIDKGGVAITDGARGCSVTPTWHLVVRGALDPEHVRCALADLISRYPVLATRVQSLDGAPPYCTRLRYAHDPAFQIDRVLEIVDLRARPADLEALARGVRNRPLDPFREFPMTLTLARTTEDSCHLLFRQHHSLADGRAFIGLLTDFAAFLEAARAGRRPTTEELAPVPRRSEVEALELPPWRRALWTTAGYGVLARSVARSLFRPTTALHQNQGLDYRGDNCTVHWILEDSSLDPWRDARRRIGVSLNSLLTAALFVANRRWHLAMRWPLGRARCELVMETRPRHGGFVSFGNHLASLEVIVPLDREGAPADIARSLQAQVERQRATNEPQKRLLAQRQVIGAMTLGDLHRIVYEQPRPLTNLDFSNLIALDFPPLGGAGWSVDEVLITTPAMPRTGVVLTVIRYRGRLVFNFNYKESVVSRAEAEALRQHFETAVVELCATT